MKTTKTSRVPTKLINRIMKLKEQGKTAPEMAVLLNKAGFTTTLGKPITSGWLYAFNPSSAKHPGVTVGARPTNITRQATEGFYDASALANLTRAVVNYNTLSAEGKIEILSQIYV